MKEYIRCSRCFKRVSSPIPTGIVVRAWVECPECIQHQECEYSRIRDAVRSYAMHHPLDLKSARELQSDLLAIADDAVIANATESEGE